MEKTPLVHRMDDLGITVNVMPWLKLCTLSFRDSCKPGHSQQSVEPSITLENKRIFPVSDSHRVFKFVFFFLKISALQSRLLFLLLNNLNKPLELYLFIPPQLCPTVLWATSSLLWPFLFQSSGTSSCVHSRALRE